MYKYLPSDGHKHIVGSYMTTLRPYKIIEKCLLCGLKLRVKEYKPFDMSKSISIIDDLTGISEEELKRFTLGT